MQISLRNAIGAAILGTAAFGGTAMAASFNDGSAGNGDAFLGITDGYYNSVVEPLGFSFTSASALTSQSWTLSLGTAINPLGATFQVFANNDTRQRGMVTTGTSQTLTDLNQGGPEVAVSYIQTNADVVQQIVQNGLNPNCADTGPCYGAHGQPQFFADQTLGSSAADFSAGISSGTTLNLYKIVNDTASTQTVTTLGTFKFAKDTADSNYTLTYTAAGSQVPLPAAIWLLGSGLAGLGAVGRRRRANAAA